MWFAIGNLDICFLQVSRERAIQTLEPFERRYRWSLTSNATKRLDGLQDSVQASQGGADKELATVREADLQSLRIDRGGMWHPRVA
jgi:hypothetical protein